MSSYRMIDYGNQLQLPQAEPDEAVDILSYVVTEAGWKALKRRLKISQSHHNSNTDPADLSIGK